MPQRVTPDVLRRGFGVLRRAVRDEPWIFALAVTGSALYGSMTVASAWVLGRVTQEVMLPAFREGEVGSGALAAAVAAIIGVALVKAIGIIGRRAFAGIMQYRLQARYRRAVTRQYLRLPLSWHQRHPTGQLLSNANADVEAAWAPLAPLPMAVGVLVMLVTAAVAMLATDLVLALVGFLIFPALALINVAYQRRLSPRATLAQQLRAEVSEVAHESFEGALVIKTLGLEAEETRRFEVRAARLREANVAVGRLRGLFDPAMEALPTLGVLAVLLAGTVRVAGGAIQPGELVQIAYLFTLLAFPIRALGWVLGELPRSVVGWDRVQSVLTAEGSLTFGPERLTGREPAGLEARDVVFSYGEGDDRHTVLHELALAVEPGRTIAVVGPTGSGKSTLAGVLMRLVDPAGGGVYVDRVDARDLRAGEIAASAALVPQQTFVFDDTVRGNVTLGMEVGDDQVWEALRLAQADGFVAALPDGLATRVGERGTSLSGGQRQRLALARALVRAPRLLVLDDATSSVDPQVEQRILAGLRDRDRPATTILVAYRRATIALADEVVYIERGRIVDRGTHEELMLRSRGYRLLVTAYERAEAERRALAASDDSDDVAGVVA